MKAIVVETCGGPEVLALADRPVPRPGEGQVLVRIRAAGVNPVDTYIRSGTRGYSPKLPFIPGMDGAGIVDAVGAGVSGIAPGDRVYVHGAGLGTCAEYCLCAEDQVFGLPSELSFTEGACLGVPYFTACRALFTRGGLRPEDSVLIRGATGGVGTACLQLLAGTPCGAVYGSAGSPEGREVVLAAGAAAVDHSLSGLPDGMEFDLIVEMLADSNLGDDLGRLDRGGRVAVVGSRGSVEVNPRDAMAREADIRGVMLLSSTVLEKRGYASRIAAGVGSGAIRPVIAAAVPLADAGEAHRMVMAAGHSGNIVIEA